MPDPSTRLQHYLTDIYSLEQQALAQMRGAPEIAGAPTLARHFEEHLTETERQAEMVEERLRAAGGSPSRTKDAILRLGGQGFLLFATVQPDSPGKLAAHGYSYEALEYAAYELLIRAAREAGDDETVRVATLIRAQEGAMRERLASDFDEAVEASFRKKDKDPAATLDAYLADAHALESQSIQLLKRGEDLAGHEELAQTYREHVLESERHAERLEERLRAIGSEPSMLKDVALRLGGLNWSLFFRALEDTPAKLAAFVYAVEHLEIAGYELLKRTAARAEDEMTVLLCDEILSDERAMVERVAASFGKAMSASVSA